MLVIGIDPGTASTGYGLIRQSSNDQLDLVDYGLISTAAGQPLPARLLDLYSALSDVLEQHKPDSSAVEQIFFQRNVKTALMVGQQEVLLCYVLQGLIFPWMSTRPAKSN